MKKLALTLLAVLALAASATPARAVFTFTLRETAGGVTVNGAGTINLAGLTSPGTVTSESTFFASTAYLFVGSPGTSPRYPITSGPNAFGNSSINHPVPSSGDRVGVYGDGRIITVPPGYVSNSALSNSATFSGQTFASLGFVPGTYTFTLANGDSLIVTSVVPEPSTWALLSIGMVGAGVVAWRRRYVA